MGDDLPTDQELDRLQWTTVLYYVHVTNPDNGPVRDKTDPAAPSNSARVTTPSPPGSCSPRCRSPPRSSSRPPAAWRRWGWAARTGRTGSGARSTGRSAWTADRPAGG